MRLAPGPVMIPPDGKLVYDKDGQRVEFLTPEEGINKLTELRAANHWPIGDPEKDITIAMAGTPGYSNPIPIAEVQARPVPRKSLIDRVGSWTANRYAGLETLKHVSALEAERRANVCAMCPRNKSWRDTCRTCRRSDKDAIDRNVVIISQNKKVESHRELFACSVVGQENRAAVWLDKECLKASLLQVDRTPQFCWLRKL